MEHIGIDVHKEESQLCVVTEEGTVLEQRIRTRRERFAAILGARARARILLEASTESEWVARCLEELGHEVIVADPNFAAMYATRSRRVKTDRRDARTLAEACRLGAYRAAHRTSDPQRQVRALLAVRQALVRTRTRYITVVRALLRREGLRVASGQAQTFAARVQRLALPELLRGTITPLLALLVPLNEQIAGLNAHFAVLAEDEDVLTRLCTVPSIGALTAATFRATLDRVDRFHGAHHVEAYLGLVPQEYSSAERQHRGSITKAGSPHVRWLLVEAGWGILRSKTPEAAPLRAWAERIAVRRGRKIAVVALARRLAGILYAIWRDGTEYKPTHLRSGLADAKAAA